MHALEPTAGPSAEDLGKLADGAAMSGFLPYLEREVEAMYAALETRVFRALDAGELTPELAFAAWQEKRAYALLLKRFSTRIRVGVAAAERVSEYMTIAPR